MMLSFLFRSTRNVGSRDTFQLKRLFSSQIVKPVQTVVVHSSLLRNPRNAAVWNTFQMKCFSSQSLEPVEPPKELDKLFKKIIVEVRGHDRAVLNSYETFVKLVIGELKLNVIKIYEPKTIKVRRTLLKSVFIFKKHRVQYEYRNYFRIFELKHLTGSTADTFLALIQIFLPEGVDMKVTKHEIMNFPFEVIPPKEENVEKV